MTIRLYDKDVDMLDFSAVVKTCAQRENGYVVTLDQTAFFPEGGGQGADHGTLGGVQVLDAHDVHGEVEHLVSAPLAIGSEVRGHVDAARRLDMMQQHSGEHMFSGLVHGLFGYDNVGFHIGTEAVTMDFNGTLTEAVIEGESGSVSSLIVGIGINLRPNPAWPEDVRKVAGAISEFGRVPRRAELIAAVLTHFEQVFALAEQGRERELVAQYRAHLGCIGRKITVISPLEKYEAECVGLNDEGHLLIRTPDGRETALSTGKISIRL